MGYEAASRQRQRRTHISGHRRFVEIRTPEMFTVPVTRILIQIRSERRLLVPTLRLIVPTGIYARRKLL